MEINNVNEIECFKEKRSTKRKKFVKTRIKMTSLEKTLDFLFIKDLPQKKKT